MYILLEAGERNHWWLKLQSSAAMTLGNFIEKNGFVLYTEKH